MHNDGEEHLRSSLQTLSPASRDLLRRILVLDQENRDAIASNLLRSRDGVGDELANLIDAMSLDTQSRRLCTRLLAEIAAAEEDPPFVVTSDADLARRLREHGAEVAGARWLLDRL